MLLAVDIGNTRIKAAVYEDHTRRSLHFSDSGSFQADLESILQNGTISDIVVSSVGEVPQLKTGANIHQVGRNWKFPFTNLYHSPETLGIDRMVLSAGAVLEFPNTNRLVIDAGTCITYDFIDEFNNYHGGAISPGLSVRYRSLHDFTARLPLLEPEVPEDFTGKTTAGSIHSGIVHGTAEEIDGFVRLYKERWGNFIIILTGGDSEFLAARLKSTIFASPNFLLDSLNAIFQYNHE